MVFCALWLCGVLAFLFAEYSNNRNSGFGFVLLFPSNKFVVLLLFHQILEILYCESCVFILWTLCFHSFIRQVLIIERTLWPYLQTPYQLNMHFEYNIVILALMTFTFWQRYTNTKEQYVKFNELNTKQRTTKLSAKW